MRRRPTVLLVHGGPGSYDHSYLTPHFGRLTAQAQVVYLDLRGHGRSARTPVADWTFEACADDLRAFCDTLGIADPVVLGHSFGGCVALLYAARHPDHPAGLVLQSTMARFDLDRLVAGFARVAGADGADIAALARRDYGGDPVTDEEWARVFAAFGPRVPDGDELARRIRNHELGEHGMRAAAPLRRGRPARPDQLPDAGLRRPGATRSLRSRPPARSPTTWIRTTTRLAILDDAGHFPWLDHPDRYWAVLTSWLAGNGVRP